MAKCQEAHSKKAYKIDRSWKSYLKVLMHCWLPRRAKAYMPPVHKLIQIATWKNLKDTYPDSFPQHPHPQALHPPFPHSEP